MTYVKSHKRKTKKGKIITVKSHSRKSTIRKVPVDANNSSVQGFAQYDVLNKETHIAVVDTDSRSMTTVTKNEPFEAEKVIVDEQPAALNIIVLGKKKKDRMVKGKLVKGKQLKSKTAVNITTLF